MKYYPSKELEHDLILQHQISSNSMILSYISFYFSFSLVVPAFKELQMLLYSLMLTPMINEGLSHEIICSHSNSLKHCRAHTYFMTHSLLTQVSN